jgi:hypothetical protein
MRGNETRNQHFVPQVEQRLNASNPDSTSGKFRIYSFRITDREAYRIELENPRGHAIASTLSMLDLFSFDVLGGGRVRMNLETLFHKYEANVAIHTKGLLEKLAAGSADIKTELIDLFAAKLLNFVRNPFCIQKVLNSFPGVGQYEPTDPELLAVYRRIVNGQKPHQTHLCRQLDVSQETYVEWLRLIFVLLMQTGDDRPNLFEGMIKGLFEARDTEAAAFVWTYDLRPRGLPAFGSELLPAHFRRRAHGDVLQSVLHRLRGLDFRRRCDLGRRPRRACVCGECLSRLAAAAPGHNQCDGDEEQSPNAGPLQSASHRAGARTGLLRGEDRHRVVTHFEFLG